MTDQPEVEPKFGRRKFLRIALGLGIGTAFVIYFGQNLFTSQAKKASESIPKPIKSKSSLQPPSARLDEYAKNIMPGGPPKDGIPPIDNPQYISRDAADSLLSNNDVIFGLEYNGAVIAYPQIVLVWHEIVNDVIGGEKISITYCPLTGSAVGFKGKSRVDGKELTFGTSGNLVNSNLLMYDKQADGNWPQILGMAINGPSKGNVLQQVALDWTTWEMWKTKHPDTKVLSTNTGYVRSYGSDPYGSYRQQRGYYFEEYVLFPVMAADTRFHPKKVVVGVSSGDSYLAVPKDEFRAKKIENIIVGSEPVVLLYEEELDVVRAYSSRIGAETLEFSMEGGKIVDRQTSSEWSPNGISTKGRLANSRLKHVNYFDVLWFAWYAFYPKTQVYL
ncbi:MAG: DUF3179 domain-containing protein [Thaumarchaeota archaeon]|nr:DUF3179 domain-containing protein [Nitrososphaerota archaeon]